MIDRIKDYKLISILAGILLLSVLVTAGVTVDRHKQDMMIRAYSEALIDALYKPVAEINTDTDVIAMFCDEWRDFLSSIPVYKVRTVWTAEAFTLRHGDLGDICVSVCTDWEELSDSFRHHLLIHEYLHQIEAYKQIDIDGFYNIVITWYNDLAYGTYDYESNYCKHSLKYNLYDELGGYYPPDNERVKGVEEFAYIGTHIVEGNGKYFSNEIIEYYRNILKVVSDE